MSGKSNRRRRRRDERLTADKYHDLRAKVAAHPGDAMAYGGGLMDVHCDRDGAKLGGYVYDVLTAQEAEEMDAADGMLPMVGTIVRQLAARQGHPDPDGFVRQIATEQGLDPDEVLGLKEAPDSTVSLARRIAKAEGLDPDEFVATVRADRTPTEPRAGWTFRPARTVQTEPGEVDNDPFRRRTRQIRCPKGHRVRVDSVTVMQATSPTRSASASRPRPGGRITSHIGKLPADQ